MKATDKGLPTYWTTESGMLKAEAAAYLEHLHELLHEIKFELYERDNTDKSKETK